MQQGGGERGQGLQSATGVLSCPRPRLSNAGNRGSQLPQEDVIVAGLP